MLTSRLFFESSGKSLSSATQIRSRFSSSDFDRAQRQQKLIMAVKDKILAINLLADPIKTLNILNSLRKNIETDLNIWDANGLFDLVEVFKNSDEKVKKYVITTENLVYETIIQSNTESLYVLLPNGDNLLGIKSLFQNILKE